jgi:hypothetical protein
MSDSCREKGSDKILIKASSIRTKFLIATTQESAKSPFYQEFIGLPNDTTMGGRSFGIIEEWISGKIQQSTEELLVENLVDKVRLLQLEMDRDCCLIYEDDAGAEADKDGIWRFKLILSHTGPLRKGQDGNNGYAWNVHVLWETGDISIEPLKNVKHDKYGCAAYACDKPKLLEQPGWKQFKKHEQHEQNLV